MYSINSYEEAAHDTNWSNLGAKSFGSEGQQ